MAESTSSSTSAAGAVAEASAAPKPKPPSQVTVTWAGERRFDAARADGRGAPVRLDGDAGTGPSPVDALVSALAACTAVDVVDILTKRRTPPAALHIDGVADRFAGTPGKLTAVRLTYRLDGEGIERPHAERAIELAVTKYCSVRDSLDPAIPVTWTLVLNGEPGDVGDAGEAG